MSIRTAQGFVDIDSIPTVVKEKEALKRARVALFIACFLALAYIAHVHLLLISNEHSKVKKDTLNKIANVCSGNVASMPVRGQTITIHGGSRPEVSAVAIKTLDGNTTLAEPVLTTIEQRSTLTCRLRKEGVISKVYVVTTKPNSLKQLVLQIKDAQNRPRLIKSLEPLKVNII